MGLVEEEVVVRARMQLWPTEREEEKASLARATAHMLPGCWLVGGLRVLL